MSTKHADLGKWAEGLVHRWLQDKSDHCSSFAYHRLPDARSAQGALAAQPADFLVGYKVDGREKLAMWLEVKETAQLHSIPKDKIRQYPKLKLFDWAGFSTIVLIYRSAHNDWTYLRGRELFHHDVTPKSFSFGGRPSFPTEKEALKEIFK